MNRDISTLSHSTEGQHSIHSNDHTTILFDQNEDYQLLSHAINLLQQQYKNCKEDIETLTRLKEQALDDPISYISRLENEEIESPPTLQTISILPELSLEKYQRSQAIPSSRRAIHSSTEEKMVELLISRIIQLQQLERKSIQQARIIPEYSHNDILPFTMNSTDLSKGSSSVVNDTRNLFKDFLPPNQEYKAQSTVLSSDERIVINSQNDANDSGFMLSSTTFDITFNQSIDDDHMNSPKRQKRYNSGYGQRGRPPGTIRRIPWTEQEVVKLRTWMSTYPQELSSGNYETIIKELKYRTVHEIRNKIQNLQHQDLLLVHVDGNNLSRSTATDESDKDQSQ